MALNVAGVVVVCAVAVVAAVLELLLVPLRSGTLLVPVSVLFAIAGNVVLPRAARVFAARTGVLAAPVLIWLIVVVLLAMTARPEGDVLIPGGGNEQWVFYAMLLLGGAAGVGTVFRSTPIRR